MAFPLLEICKQPRLMALVTNPERKLCAPKHDTSNPRRRAPAFTMTATACPVAQLPQRFAAHGGRHAEHNVACGRLLPDRRGADGTPDARKGGLNGLSANRARHAGDLMHVADGREAPL